MICNLEELGSSGWRLKKNGGHVEFGKAWADSFMHCHGFVKRKGTKAARKLPSDFENVKADFLERIENNVIEHKIPADKIVNRDQTGLKFIPVSEWTMAKKGSKQVELFGKGDKCEMTVLLSVTSTGTVLPPQLIYKGTMGQCHPRFKFRRYGNIFIR